MSDEEIKKEEGADVSLEIPAEETPEPENAPAENAEAPAEEVAA